MSALHDPSEQLNDMIKYGCLNLNKYKDHFIQEIEGL